MASPAAETARPGFLEALAVYLQPRVLIVLFLGFTSGLPLALSGTTLQIWSQQSGVSLQTIGLFALIGTPYTLKFIWAPVIDAIDVPLLSRWLGRRRGWLVFSQLLLVAAIVFLAFCDPASAPLTVAFGAFLVAATSATQDIVVDAFRVESLPEREQAAGMAGYVAAYRIGMLVSTAGVLFLVTFFEDWLGLAKGAAWTAGLLAMAALVPLGMVTSIVATEPERSVAAQAARSGRDALARVSTAAIGAAKDFIAGDMAIVALAFVVLFKFADALAGAMTAAFVIDIGFTRDEYAAIVKVVGFAATLAGGFAGGFLARSYPLSTSLWIGGFVQAVANLIFCWQATIGHNNAALAVSISVENFTAGIGTVMFVAYLSALCRNPLHTATQYALLTALAAVGRTYLSSTAGFIAAATGWVWFFAICAAAGIPGLLLLWWLQRGGHFDRLERST